MKTRVAFMVVGANELHWKWHFRTNMFLKVSYIEKHSCLPRLVWIWCPCRCGKSWLIVRRTWTKLWKVHLLSRPKLRSPRTYCRISLPMQGALGRQTKLDCFSNLESMELGCGLEGYGKSILASLAIVGSYLKLQGALGWRSILDYLECSWAKERATLVSRWPWHCWIPLFCKVLGNCICCLSERFLDPWIRISCCKIGHV